MAASFHDHILTETSLSISNLRGVESSVRKVGKNKKGTVASSLSYLTLSVCHVSCHVTAHSNDIFKLPLAQPLDSGHA